MGILDGIDLSGLDPELLKLLRGAQPDNKAAVNQGLMAAGLGMLANANKGFAGGVGSGGLLGLEAYNTERQRQTKDPMQQINMLSGILGLNQNLQSQATMRNIQQAMSGGQQGPAPESAPDFVGPPASAAPNYTPPPTAQGGLYQALSAALLDPKLASMAKGAMEARGWMPQNLRPNSSLVMPDGRGNFTAAYTAPDLGQGQRLGPNGAELIPGYQQNIAAVAGAKTGAEEAARARYTTVNTTQDGRPVMVTAERFAAENAPTGQTAPVSGIPATPELQDYLGKNGIPNVKDERTGQLLIGKDAQAYQAPRGRLGVGQTEAEKAAVMTPVKVAEQKALAPGVTQAEMQKQVVAKTVDRLQEVTKGADEATQAAPKLARVMDRISKGEGIYGGAAAPGVLGFAKWLNAVGIPFDSKRFADSQESAAYMDSIGLGLIKQFVGSQNISDADRVAVMSIVPRLPTDPNARWEMFSLFADINDRRVADARQFQAHVKKGGTVVDYSYNWMKTTDPQATRAPISLEQARANAQRTAPQGTTDKPPMTGARQAPDGNWYIKNGNQYLKVVP